MVGSRGPAMFTNRRLRLVAGSYEDVLIDWPRIGRPSSQAAKDGGRSCGQGDK